MALMQTGTFSKIGSRRFRNVARGDMLKWCSIQAACIVKDIDSTRTTLIWDRMASASLQPEYHG